MKNIIFTMLAFFAAISITFASSQEIKKVKTFNKPIQIHINFTVASPRSGCSAFPGICKMTGGLDYGKIPSGLNSGGLASYQNGVLTIEVANTDMSDELITNFSKISSFPIDEPVILDPVLLKSLGAPAGAMIQPGKSAIIKDADRIKLILILK